MENRPKALRARIELTQTPIDPTALAAEVADPGSGAVALFLGTVRDHSPGKPGVTHLEYEAYLGVAEGKIREVVEEAAEKWPLRAVTVVHRTGKLEVGEVSVGVGVATAHRPDALEAAGYIIDQLKARAPIWKKEHWDGGAEWVREGSS